MVKIDAHQHFWRLNRGDYPWMPPDGPLHRDYLPADYAPLAAAAGIAGSVLVQAAPTVAETEYLLSLADEDDTILGVVGWVDLENSADGQLERLAAHPKFVGVRPMIQDEPDDEWITRPAVVDGLRRVGGAGLAFDLLCRPRHLSYAIRVLSEVPELRVVIDHLGKPDYTRLDDVWLEGMAELATLPNTYCKIAGLVTERHGGIGADGFRAHLDTIFGLFEPRRLMVGTDWPVLNTHSTFGEVVALYDELLSGLSPEARAEVWAGTAAELYGLSIPESRDA